MTPREIIENYYDNLEQKNDVWSTMYSDEITFSDAGMNINEAGNEAVTNSFKQFLKSVEDIRVRQLIVENENICAVVLYSFCNPEGEKMSQNVSEIWRVKEGKLNSLIIYFDFTAYRKFMGL